jgi:hypothetical protein
MGERASLFLSSGEILGPFLGRDLEVEAELVDAGLVPVAADDQILQPVHVPLPVLLEHLIELVIPGHLGVDDGAEPVDLLQDALVGKGGGDQLSGPGEQVRPEIRTDLCYSR